LPGGGYFIDVCETDKNKKRFTFSYFKGNISFQIRDFYQNKDEEWAPGKAGIPIPLSAVDAFVSIAASGAIEEAIALLSSEAPPADSPQAAPKAPKKKISLKPKNKQPSAKGKAPSKTTKKSDK
jgi:hypothetical protein